MLRSLALNHADYLVLLHACARLGAMLALLNWRLMVAQAAVIGVPDPRWQEGPVAFVVVRAGRSVSAEVLRAHLLTQLARFKIPRDVVFVSELPRNALGKVQHFRLKKSWRG